MEIKAFYLEHRAKGVYISLVMMGQAIFIEGLSSQRVV